MGRPRVLVVEQAEKVPDEASRMEETLRIPVEVSAEWARVNSLNPTPVRQQEASVVDRVVASQGVEAEHEARAEIGDEVNTAAEAVPDKLNVDAVAAGAAELVVDGTS